MPLVNILLMMIGMLTIPSIVYARVICVDANTTSSEQVGSCWDKPFKELQQALNAAENDRHIREIWLAKGVYRPTKTYTPRNHQNVPIIAGAFSQPQHNPGVTAKKRLINYLENPNQYNAYLQTFNLIDGVSLYGGFAGNEKSRTARDRNPLRNRSILDGQLSDYAVWHVVTAGNDLTGNGVTLTLDRLTIRGGNAEQAPYFPKHFPLKKGEVPIYYHDDGGGLYIFSYSDITLNQVVFEYNRAVAGGAIFVQDGSQLEIKRCTFMHNQAFNGAVLNIRLGGPNEFRSNKHRKTTVQLLNNHFENNTSQWGPNIFTNDNQSSLP